ncbi:MAG: lytic transglycosylase domain-containing protein [Verrucomicrobia bacterium]|nr:lytic transglycosylase domain-containing protein [Verrucomicrobiota bacterium]
MRAIAKAELSRHTGCVSRWRTLRGLLSAVAVLAALGVTVYFGHQYWREHRFDDEIMAVALKHGISPFLVKAVVWRESRFDPNARGGKGEIGLMQIMPGTANEWAKAHHVAGFDPQQALLIPTANLDVGCWYLRRALDRWTTSTSDPVPFALAEYNAGRSNALRWATGPKPFDPQQFISNITYPVTRKYILTTREQCQRYAARGHL